MKKTLKIILILLSVFISNLGILSCSDDDDSVQSIQDGVAINNFGERIINSNIEFYVSIKNTGSGTVTGKLVFEIYDGYDDKTKFVEKNISLEGHASGEYSFQDSAEFPNILNKTKLVKVTFKKE